MRITATNIDDVFKAPPASVDTMELMGFEHIETLFADSSGFGQPDEMAMTPEQLTDKLKGIVATHGTVTAKLIGVGMFQVNIGIFTKTGTKRARKIASNVLLIDNKIIRLYDTDIITDNGDGTLTLNTGGYNTMTTSKRMNEFTNVYVNRKDWVMHAGGVPFENDRITVDGSLRGL